MIRLFARSLAFGLTLLASFIVAGAALAQKSFVNDNLASDAVRLETALRTEGSLLVGGRSLDQLKREAAAFTGRGSPRDALARYTAAIALDAKDFAAWLGFARAAAAIDPQDYRERYTVRERGTVAAYAAYLRATTKPDEASALAALGQSYAVRSFYRPALNAYRASLAAAESSGVRATYEDLREKHGFRIADYKVDSDSASPRICFQFSEPLATGKVDFAPFVVLSGAANAAVSADGNASSASTA